jgi:hypothetical protein
MLRFIAISTLLFKNIVGVASSHDFYAPLLNRIAPCPRTRSKLLQAAIIMVNFDGQKLSFALWN